MKKKIMLLFAAIILISITCMAVKTSKVEFGEDGTYDGQVGIYRDESGRLVFMDAENTVPVPLSDVTGGTDDHGELVSLGADHHTQYMNSSRHDISHDAAFNDALAINPGVGGHTTAGGHFQDADIHLNRSLPETVLSSWMFDSMQKFGDGIHLSSHGETGKSDVSFEDGEEDARMQWNPETEKFEFNRGIKTESLETTDGKIQDLRVPGNLYGNEISGGPTGIISNFFSIEGIESGNLLDKSANETVSGNWTFQNLTVNGNLEAPTEANIITVAKSGGDYTSVASAVSNASSGDAVLVYPGTYTETGGVQMNTANVSLVGVDRERCIIERDNSIVTMNSDDGTINMRAAGCSLENLTIKNIGSGDASPAVICNNGVGNIRNCYLGANGGRDILTLYSNTADIECYGVTVEQYDVSNNASHPIWVAGDCSLTFEHGAVIVSGSGDGAQFNTTGDVTFKFSYFDTGAYIADVDGCNTLAYYFCKQDGSGLFATESWNTLKTQMLMYGDNYIYDEDIQLLGDLKAGGGSFYVRDNGDVEYSSSVISPCMYWDKSEGTIVFKSNPSGNPANLYLNAANNLKTDDKFTADGGLQDGSMSSAGFVKNDASGNLSGGNSLTDPDIPNDITISSDNIEGASTRWEYFNAAANFGYWGYTGSWSLTPGQYCNLTCSNDGAVVYIPINYSPGTKITRIRTKWLGKGANDGVKVLVQKRDESGSGFSMIDVGSEQTYTNPTGGTSPDVTTYDLPDETIQEGYAYIARVTAIVATDKCHLLAIGIETEGRNY